MPTRSLEVEYPNLAKFTRAAQEFSVYIASNTGSLRSTMASDIAPENVSLRAWRNHR